MRLKILGIELYVGYARQQQPAHELSGHDTFSFVTDRVRSVGRAGRGHSGDAPQLPSRSEEQQSDIRQR